MVSVPVQCPYCQSTEVIKAGKLTGHSAIGVKTSTARGGSFSCSTRIAAAYLRSAARSSTWLSMAAGSAIPPTCCGSVPRPCSRY